MEICKLRKWIISVLNDDESKILLRTIGTTSNVKNCQF